MPAYLTPLHVEISLRDRRESIHERRDRYRGKLKINTPDVPEEIRKRWYGAPPTKFTVNRRPAILAF